MLAAAQMKDKGENCTLQASMAKLCASASRSESGHNLWVTANL